MDDVVTLTGVTTVMARFVDDVSCGFDESMTVTLAVLVPAAVGVPVIWPVLWFMTRPAGRPVADQERGVWPPCAVTVVEYPIFTVALGSGEVAVRRNGEWRLNCE